MDTDAVLRMLVEVAEEAINPHFRTLGSGQVMEKNPGDLVTVADHHAEELITARLRAAYPDAMVFGEEASETDPSLAEAFRNAAHGFTVDPVDGTKNFVHGSPDHAVMVAEVRDGETVRSWIWQPQHELAYVAERGAGAFRNGEKLLVTDPGDDPSAWRASTSRRAWIGQSYGPLGPLGLTWVSCGIDYPHLAEGDTDLLVYHRSKAWDHAPGGLLVTEAGGHLGTRDGRTYSPVDPHPGGLVAAATPEVYAVAQGLLAG